jgi:DNA-binding transcriptional LysR family regulator
MELSSYHAIVACAASGTGIAFIPRSVLDTVRGAEHLAVYPLSGTQGRVTTCLVWRKGESSLALNALKLQLGKSRKGGRQFNVGARSRHPSGKQSRAARS